MTSPDITIPHAQNHWHRHLPGGPDEIEWSTRIHGSSTLALRPAAGPTNKGVLWLVTDDDGGTLFRSDGSTWTAVAAGVTEASSALSTHVAAADPHTGYVLESLLDAKGDLIAASADNTPAKVTAGANNTLLIADSTQPAGVKWAIPNEFAAWTSYTPSLTQSATVTKTVTYAKWIQIGKTVHVTIYLSATSAGTANNIIKVGVPTAVPASTTARTVVGTGWVNDVSVPWFWSGPVFYNGSGDQTFSLKYTDSTQSLTLGLTGTLTLASGDEIAMSLTYETA